jgi:hypothetical protein
MDSKCKILAIMIEDLPWMYYGKYKTFLSDLDHPLRDTIDFVVDEKMMISEEKIKEYRVVLFFHRDPLERLYPDVYHYAKRLQMMARDNGIRFVNDPDSLSRSMKSEQLQILFDNGFRVAKSFPFDLSSELALVSSEFYPLFVRNDYGHDSDNLTMQGPFDSYEDIVNNLREQSLAHLRHLDGRVAIQWLNTKSKDGYFRRYRAFATHKDAVTGNLHISNDWYVHGVNNSHEAFAIKEHEAFTRAKYSKGEIEFFTSISGVLDLEFCAIDYGYNKNGDIIIWEANPHPAFPSWVDKEPTRSNVTRLLSDLYQDILDQAISR